MANPACPNLALPRLHPLLSLERQLQPTLYQSQGSTNISNTDELGPIDYVAVGFPDGKMGAQVMRRLLDLVDQGVVGVLDIEFLSKTSDGVVAIVASAVATGDGTSLAEFEGASSGLLDADDLTRLGSDLAVGAVAVVIVIENLWMMSLVRSWRDDGAVLLGDGGLSADDVVAALDSTEASR